MGGRKGKFKSNREFQQVMRRGRSYANDLAVLYVLGQPETEPTRFGVSVPRRFGKAVVRNRVRRLFWEAHRRLGDACGGRWLVVIPRNRARGKRYAEVHAALADLRGRAGVRSAAAPVDVGGGPD